MVDFPDLPSAPPKPVTTFSFACLSLRLSQCSLPSHCPNSVSNLFSIELALHVRGGDSQPVVSQRLSNSWVRCDGSMGELITSSILPMVCAVAGDQLKDLVTSLLLSTTMTMCSAPLRFHWPWEVSLQLSFSEPSGEPTRGFGSSILAWLFRQEITGWISLLDMNP